MQALLCVLAALRKGQAAMHCGTAARQCLRRWQVNPKIYRSGRVILCHRGGHIGCHELWCANGILIFYRH